MENLTPQETDNSDIRASLEASFNASDTSETNEVQAEQTIGAEKISDEAKAERARDATGKFAKAATESTETSIEPTEAPQPKPSPKSLKKELADKHWANLDPELQDALLQRDEDFAKGIEGYKTHAERGQAFEKVVSPYMATIRSLGATPEQAAEELFRSDHTLRYGSPQQKYAMVEHIFRNYGINLNEAFNYLQNGAPKIDPSIEPVYQELQSLKQQQAYFMQAQQARENQALQSEIERAKEGKEHFDAVREDMAALLQANRAESLDQAYEMAIWARPDLRATLLQQERDNATKSAQSSAQAQRSAASAVSVKGSSPVSNTTQPENLRDLIASQF